jgi:hypothetical protein
MKAASLLVATLVCLFACSQAPAIQIVTGIAFDEWGNGIGTLGPGFFDLDPTFGVPDWNVLIYNLPFPGVPGDVILMEPLEGAAISDIIRFTGNGQAIFYSDSSDGFHEPADVPQWPDPLWPNQAVAYEVGVEGNNWADYVPTPNQPGWDASVSSYHFVSDGIVPEPATLALLAAGAVGALIRRKQR